MSRPPDGSEASTPTSATERRRKRRERERAESGGRKEEERTIPVFLAVHPERIANPKIRAEGVKRQITQSKEHCAAEQPRCVVIFSLPIDVCVYDVLFVDTSKKKKKKIFDADNGTGEPRDWCGCLV
jgi:hypothetical protein